MSIFRVYSPNTISKACGILHIQYLHAPFREEIFLMLCVSRDELAFTSTGSKCSNSYWKAYIIYYNVWSMACPKWCWAIRKVEFCATYCNLNDLAWTSGHSFGVVRLRQYCTRRYLSKSMKVVTRVSKLEWLVISKIALNLHKRGFRTLGLEYSMLIF
jgi:hypothetical protein